MHACTAAQRHHAQEIAHLLDPCYHIDPSKCSPSSPCPSVLAASSSSTWRDASGKHDPDFRPFASPRRLSAPLPLTPSPRGSLDLPPTPPSKAERAAARRELSPALREALQAHERQLAKERCEERRPAWLKRHRAKSTDSGTEYTVDDEEAQDDASYASPISPPPLPELVSDYGSDDDEDASREDADEKPSPCDQIRHQLASITLRVDLAVFRAKKRLRRRVGLE